MSTIYSTPQCPREIALSSAEAISHIYFQSGGVKAKLVLHFRTLKYIDILYFLTYLVTVINDINMVSQLLFITNCFALLFYKYTVLQ